MTIGVRILQEMESKGYTRNSLAKKTGIHPTTLNNWIVGNTEPDSLKLDILSKVLGVNIVWLKTGKGRKTTIDVPSSRKEHPDTRPRIPMNAAAGSVSIALHGVTSEECEQMPVIQAFPHYNFTIFVKGDSMEPEFHSGDELACLQISHGDFIQWGRYHVLDTGQGVLVKRIYDDGDYILCKSELSELYNDFKIHKSDIYNLALVIGMIRRY